MVLDSNPSRINFATSHERQHSMWGNIEDEDGVTGQRVSKESDKNQEPVISNIEATDEREDIGKVDDGDEYGGSHGGNGSKIEEKRGREKIEKGKEQVSGEMFPKYAFYIEAVASYFPSTLKLPVNS